MIDRDLRGIPKGAGHAANVTMERQQVACGRVTKNILIPFEAAMALDQSPPLPAKRSDWPMVLNLAAPKPCDSLRLEPNYAPPPCFRCRRVDDDISAIKVDVLPVEPRELRWPDAAIQPEHDLRKPPHHFSACEIQHLARFGGCQDARRVAIYCRLFNLKTGVVWDVANAHRMSKENGKHLVEAAPRGRTVMLACREPIFNVPPSNIGYRQGITSASKSSERETEMPDVSWTAICRCFCFDYFFDGGPECNGIPRRNVLVRVRHYY